jgi:outer membrane protein
MVLRSSLISAMALLGIALAGNAQQAAQKVGVISVQGAIVGTKDGQKASQALDQKFAPKKKEFDTRQSELSQLQDQYNKGGSLMSEDKRNQLARDIDEKKRRLERDVQDAQEELQGEQQKLLQSLGQRMMAVIEKYAKDNSYNVILDVSNPNTPVLYASSAIDITQDIVSLYDKTSTNGAPAPTTTTPNAAPGISPANKPAPRPTNPGSGAAATRPPGTPR